MLLMNACECVMIRDDAVFALFVFLMALAVILARDGRRDRQRRGRYDIARLRAVEGVK